MIDFANDAPIAPAAHSSRRQKVQARSVKPKGKLLVVKIFGG